MCVIDLQFIILLLLQFLIVGLRASKREKR